MRSAGVDHDQTANRFAAETYFVHVEYEPQRWKNWIYLIFSNSVYRSVMFFHVIHIMYLVLVSRQFCLPAAHCDKNYVTYLFRSMKLSHTSLVAVKTAKNIVDMEHYLNYLFNVYTQGYRI